MYILFLATWCFLFLEAPYSFAWDDYNLSQVELFYKHQEEQVARNFAKTYDTWWASGGFEEDVSAVGSVVVGLGRAASRI